MTLTYKNFEIEVTENSYDLYQTRAPKQTHLTKGSDDIRCCHGYYSKLPSVIRKIIQIEMSSREEKVALTNYIELYKRTWNQIEASLSA